MNARLLKLFQVRGWIRKDVTINGVVKSMRSRIPMTRVEIISATDGLAAAKQYARSHGIRDSQWMDSKYDSSPFCVIRVSNDGDRAP